MAAKKKILWQHMAHSVFHGLIYSGKVEVITPFYISQVKKEENIHIVGTRNGEQKLLTGFEELIVNVLLILIH